MIDLKEYFEELDKKNLFLIYFLFFICVGFIYYNYNYSVLSERIKKYNERIEKLRKEIEDVGLLPTKLDKLKKQIKKLEERNFSLNEDLKYINMLIKSSNILNINEESFLVILENILKKAVLNKIEASYIIGEKIEGFKIYTIDVTGNFEKEYFYNFFNFIKDLESVRKIKSIKVLNFKKNNNNIEFYLKIDFWSIL